MARRHGNLLGMRSTPGRNDEELDRVLEILWLATDAAEDGRPVYGEGLLRYMLSRAEGQAASEETGAPGIINAYRQSLAFYLSRYGAGR